MEQLIKLFLQLVDIGYQAGIAVLFVLAARALLTMIRAPKKYICMLWFLPLVRLAFPIQPESIFSLLPKQNSPGTALADLVNEPVRYVSSKDVIRSQMPVMPAVDVPKLAETQPSFWMLTLVFVWLAGVIVFGIFALFSMWRLKRKLRMSVRLQENIYLTDGLPSAFVFGIFRPKIYLPSDMGEKAKSYVIAHEKAHIRRKDHISKLAVYYLLCIYWMNPVLWIGYYFFRKDVELACDEAVISREDEDYRRNYAKALLELSVSEKSFTGIPLAFAEESPKERIEMVMEYKRPKLVAAVVGILLLTVLAAGLLTNPVKAKKATKAPAARNDNAVYETDDETREDMLFNTAGVFDGLYYMDETGTAQKLFEDQQVLKASAAASAGLHRAGFEPPGLCYYAPRNSAYAYALKDVSEEERFNEKAQDALRELYDLTGYQVEECCYYYIDSSESICFGMNEDDLEHDRIFYSRDYGEIESIYLVSKRRVWYSSLDMLVYPEGYDRMTEEEKAVWFVTHSGMYYGQKVADAYQPYEWDLNIWHVVMDDDTTYEITLDSEADIVGSIYGPYSTSNIQH